MQIPVENIYFLLAYAWDKLKEAEFVNVSADNKTNVLQLLTYTFLNGSKRLCKKGLIRDYISQNDLYNGIKGKFDLTNTLKSNVLGKGAAICHFDELSGNILPNQLIKSTLVQIQKIKIIPSLNKEISQVLIHFSEVDYIPVSSHLFSKARSGYNDPFYAFLLNICELLHENLQIESKSGKYLFRDFTKDERQMAKLFEAFVRNFYKIELRNFIVKREDLHWQLKSSLENVKFLPKMQTDITLINGNRKVIIDTKFYKETLQKNFNTQKINSENLFQLFTYLKNQNDPTCEGILLYPTVEHFLSLSYYYNSHQIRIETINLNQPWQKIHEDLLSLILK